MMFNQSEGLLNTGSGQKPVIDMIVGYLIGCLALFELARIINFPGLTQIYDGLFYFELCLLVYVLCSVSFRGNKWFFLLGAGLLILLLTALFRGNEAFEKTIRFIKRGVLVYILCPAIGVLIPRQYIKFFLRFFIGLWTLFYSAVCVLGIIAVTNGTVIPDMSGIRLIEIRNDGRLCLFYWATITAANLSLSLMMSLIGMQLYKQKWLKIYYFLIMIPMFVCLALTNGRSGYVSTGVGIGLACVCIFYPIIRRKIKRRLFKTTVCCLIIAAITGSILFLNYQIVNVYNNKTINRHSGNLLLITPAKAEEGTYTGEDGNSLSDNRQTVADRQLFNSDTLTGRDRIWGAAFETIKNHPEILAIGTSAGELMTYFNQYSPDPGLNYHVHNMLLQILMETGIVGLVLAMVFLYLFIRSACRMATSSELPLWQRLVFLPAAIGLMMEMVDCLMWLGWSTQHQVVVMIFAGLTLVFGKEPKNCAKNY